MRLPIVVAALLASLIAGPARAFEPPIVNVWQLISWSKAPNTAVYISDIAIANTRGLSFVWLLWGTRCDLCSNTKDKKPNLYGSQIITFTVGSTAYQARTSYTDYEKADAATKAQLLAALGYQAHQSTKCPLGYTQCGYLDITEAANIPDSKVWNYAYAQTNADRLFKTKSEQGNFYTAANAVVLPSGLLERSFALSHWIMVDSEMTDLRPARQETELIVFMARVAHLNGYNLAVWTDPILAVRLPKPLPSTGQYSGFCGVNQIADPPNCSKANGGPNLPGLIRFLDAMMIDVAEPPTAGYTTGQVLEKSLALFGPSPPLRHIGVNFALGVAPNGTTIDEAKTARGFILKYGLPTVMFLPLYATYSSAPCDKNNLKIDIVLGLSTDGCPLN